MQYLQRGEYKRNTTQSMHKEKHKKQLLRTPELFQLLFRMLVKWCVVCGGTVDVCVPSELGNLAENARPFRRFNALRTLHS